MCLCLIQLTPIAHHFVKHKLPLNFPCIQYQVFMLLHLPLQLFLATSSRTTRINCKSTYISGQFPVKHTMYMYEVHQCRRQNESVSASRINCTITYISDCLGKLSQFPVKHMSHTKVVNSEYQQGLGGYSWIKRSEFKQWYYAGTCVPTKEKGFPVV